VAIIGALVTLVVNVVEYFALPWRRRGGRRRGRRRAGPQR
jgi:hypothetical protein